MIGLYYRGLAWAFTRVFGAQQMLHYPMFGDTGQSLLDGQRGLTDLCAQRLGELAGRDLIEVGCGNGEQAMYLHARYHPASTRGVDLHPPHIAHAIAEARARNLTGIAFSVDDAQRLGGVESESADFLLCTESAHHYRDKAAFLAQAKRVLRSGGTVLLAEILVREGKAPGFLDRRKSTYYWTLEQYLEVFAAAGLEIVHSEDISASLLRGFETSDGWFAAGRHGPSAWLGRVMGKALVAYYSGQLRHNRRYMVLAGRKP